MFNMKWKKEASARDVAAVLHQAPPGNQEASTLYSRLHKHTMAEREGFEPPVPFGTAVFKTAAIDHSAISPCILSRPGDGRKRTVRFRERLQR